MAPGIALNDLLDYTEWQRQKWLEWLRCNPAALEPVGDKIRHIFSAETRYIERLSNRPLTPPASIPLELEPLFDFGRQSRAALRRFIDTCPPERWDEMLELPFLNNSVLVATTRKIIVHVLMHEIRHWAQLATICRVAGVPPEMQDFIFSPVFGGELRRAAEGNA